MVKLRYGNTNCFFLEGKAGGVLVDTDYAGTLPRFFKAIKEKGIGMGQIRYLMLTHCHPDHVGLAGELQALGVTPVIFDVQLPEIHFADGIFAREGRRDHKAVDEKAAKVITCGESRAFLKEIGIEGEVIHTPSHSRDSVSLILDDGTCLVGDLAPFSHREADPENEALKRDWEQIFSHGPKRICFAHANEKEI